MLGRQLENIKNFRFLRLDGVRYVFASEILRLKLLMVGQLVHFDHQSMLDGIPRCGRYTGV